MRRGPRLRQAVASRAPPYLAAPMPAAVALGHLAAAGCGAGRRGRGAGPCRRTSSKRINYEHRAKWRGGTAGIAGIAGMALPNPRLGRPIGDPSHGTPRTARHSGALEAPRERQCGRQAAYPAGGPSGPAGPAGLPEPDLRPLAFFLTLPRSQAASQAAS